ncbi:MAG: hypothetical protein SFX72_02490 [Isosphaeraceae bacterium]|nr:hypothetical protein [Isosphaeraceae bacterium]
MERWVALMLGVAAFVGFSGWGGFFTRRVLRDRQAGWGIFPATGMALTVVVGGVLDLLSAISATRLDLWIGIGCLLCVREFISDRARVASSLDSVRWSRWSSAAGWGVALWASIRILSSVHPESLNEFDDLTGYVVYPTRMLQSGGIGVDPFNARRLESSLGGMSILHACVLGHASDQHLPMVDLGIGLAAALGAAAEFARSRRMKSTLLAAPLLMVAYDPTPMTNITAVMTGIAFTIGLIAAVERPGRGWGRVVSIALFASALCAVKSSYIPVAVLFLAIHYLDRAIRLREFGEGVGVLILTSLMTLPWMIGLKASSGTLLYPILGRGFHGSVHGTFVPPSSHLGGAGYLRNLVVGLTDPNGAAALIGASISMILGWSRTRDEGEGRVSVAFQAAVLLNTLVMLRLFEFVDALRYLSPLFTVSLVVSLVDLGGLASREHSRESSGNASSAFAAMMFVTAFALGASWWSSRSLIVKPTVRNALHLLEGGRLTSPEEIDAARRAQGTIEPGEPVLVWTAKPYLLDFRRNPLYVLDWPGVAGPAPGLPIGRGGEAVARYLETVGIRRILISPAVREIYPATEADVEAMTSGWSRAVSVLALRFWRDLEELRSSRTTIEAGTGYLVLELDRPRPEN